MEASLSTETHRNALAATRRTVGGPVDVATSANTHITVGFWLHGPVPLCSRRYHGSSHNIVAYPLDWRHDHGYDRTLIYDIDGLTYVCPSGSRRTFSIADGRETGLKLDSY